MSALKTLDPKQEIQNEIISGFRYEHPQVRASSLLNTDSLIGSPILLAEFPL